jgi:5-methylcytosine-specific restriction endonuclease McrA
VSQQRTLILNANYVPITVVPIHRAVVMVLSERAEIVETSGEYLHSQWLAVEVPLVVRLLSLVRIPFKRRVPITRRSVLQRDGHVCGYCKGRADTVDHVVPRGQGGRHTWRNVTAACRPCNGRKGNRTPAEAGMVLHAKPFEPAGQTALVVVVGTVDEAWEPWLQHAPAVR